MSKRSISIAVVAAILAVSSLAGAAKFVRSIAGLPKASADAFNDCVDDWADASDKFKEENPGWLEGCCGGVRRSCEFHCGDDQQCGNACNDAKNYCAAYEHVKGVPASTELAPELWQTGFYPELYPTRRGTGDFDGDGRQDLVAFFNTTYTDGRRGDVQVALSNGRDGFEPPALWNGWFCAYGSQICETGDFDGDGRDDLFSLTRGDGSGRGYVAVARSTGASFASPFTAYSGAYGRDWQDLEVADMNGDGRDDVVLYRKGDGSDTSHGDVAVLLSNGTNALVAQTTGGSFPGCSATIQGCDDPVVAHPIWHPGFCFDQDECHAGDLDGDGEGDLVAFRPTRGDVVYTSCGYSYTERRHKCSTATPSPLPFPMDSLVYAFGDVDGDGQADLQGFAFDRTVTLGTRFLRDTSSGSPMLTLQVFDGPYDCVSPQACQLADVNGDAQADLVEITFVAGGLGNPGDVWVTLAPYFDTDGDLVPDEADNCPVTGNPDQVDTDGDGTGDACPSECSDGGDNDHDGLADAQDPGCATAGDLSERGLAACDDGADNDGDGLVDYPWDPQCQSPIDADERAAACGLGIEQAFLLPLLFLLRRLRRRKR